MSRPREASATKGSKSGIEGFVEVKYVCMGGIDR
jgi:hypothetical protein